MNTPLLSFVISAKDQSPFIRDTMTSLEHQFDDPRAMEVIFVDDGSSDGTGELVEAFAGRLPGLKFLCNEKAWGLATARNQGPEAATGTTIAFLDGDDWLAPGHLQVCLAARNRLDVDFCGSTTSGSPTGVERSTGPRRLAGTRSWTPGPRSSRRPRPP